MAEELKKLKVYCETSFVCYLSGDATDDVELPAHGQSAYVAKDATACCGGGIFLPLDHDAKNVYRK